MNTAHYQDDTVTLWHGNCLAVLREMPDNSIDSIVTDPPYGLSQITSAQIADVITAWVTGNREAMPTGRGFMGAEWDVFVPPPAVWDECLRVLKPGGHLLAFAGTRTMDLMGLSIRLAGFEIRDSHAWLHGSGFPKAMDVAKAITGHQMGHGSNSVAIRRATMGDEYVPSGVRGNRDGPKRRSDTGMSDRTLRPTADAERWRGWATALKPAFEPIVMARKPIDGTVAANVLKHGTGALNISGCRIGDGRRTNQPMGAPENSYGGYSGDAISGSTIGRWPANVILDESQAAVLDAQSGTSYDDTGGASRFFYVAKADTAERPKVGGVAHATVKPLSLMQWLVRLVTPPGGVVLDPYAGSGTTAEACIIERFRCVVIEREDDHLPLILARIHRQRDPIAYTKLVGDDLGLFGLLDDEVS